MWNFTSLVCRVDARPHRAQRDACTALVSSENPAHLRQKMREIEPNLYFLKHFGWFWKQIRAKIWYAELMSDLTEHRETHAQL